MHPLARRGGSRTRRVRATTGGVLEGGPQPQSSARQTAPQNRGDLARRRAAASASGPPDARSPGAHARAWQVGAPRCDRNAARDNRAYAKTGGRFVACFVFLLYQTAPAGSSTRALGARSAAANVAPGRRGSARARAAARAARGSQFRCMEASATAGPRTASPGPVQHSRRPFESARVADHSRRSRDYTSARGGGCATGVRTTYQSASPSRNADARPSGFVDGVRRGHRVSGRGTPRGQHPGSRGNGQGTGARAATGDGRCKARSATGRSAWVCSHRARGPLWRAQPRGGRCSAGRRSRCPPAPTARPRPRQQQVESGTVGAASHHAGRDSVAESTAPPRDARTTSIKGGP